MGAAFSAELDFAGVLDRLLSSLARLVPYEAAAVLQVEGSLARVIRRAGQVGTASLQNQLEISATPNLRRMAETGQPLVIADVETDPGWAWRGIMPPMRSGNSDSVERAFLAGQGIRAGAILQVLAFANGNMLVKVANHTVHLAHELVGAIWVDACS